MKIHITFILLMLISACSVSTSSNTDVEHASDDVSAEDNMTKIMIRTNKGDIIAELYDEKAPVTVENFKKLIGEKFYDNLTWHRYVEGFVIQGGDPDGDGTGGSKDKIKLEINPELTHVKGALGMARSQDPDSASSQFYIALDDIHDLDGNYAVFGKVIDGMDVVLKLRQGDVMEEIRIVE